VESAAVNSAANLTAAAESSAPKAVAAEIAVEPALKSAPFKVARAVKAVAVKPGAGADKHAVREPPRSIVAVRRARVRVITIVAVGTDRRRTVVGRTIVVAGAHAYAHKDSLRVRKGCEEEANPE